MGAISSSVALSLNEFAASEEVVYFSGGAAVPITGSACNEWVYRFETNTAQIAEAISDYTVNELGSNVWFHIADYAYDDSVYQRTRQRMEQGSNCFSQWALRASSTSTRSLTASAASIGRERRGPTASGVHLISSKPTPNPPGRRVTDDSICSIKSR